MKAILGLLLFVSIVSTGTAQMTGGLTGKPDTSYTTYSAFQSTRKKYPGIQIVRERKYPGVKEKRNIVYCAAGEKKLYLDAFYPSAARKRFPAILIIHGGRWRSGNRSQHIPLAQKLASMGYTCFTAEYTLSTNALYPEAVYDLKAALRWIRANGSKYKADTGKVVALGFSSGGELAAFLGTTNSDARYEDKSCLTDCSSKVNAVVDIDGTLSFVHPESGEGNDTKSISAATYWFGYPKKENYKLWEDASPLTHADKNTPPFLFINSSVERMHAGRDDFRKILQDNGIYSEVHTYPDSPHSFCLFEPWFTPTADFINEFLKKVFSKP